MTTKMLRQEGELHPLLEELNRAVNLATAGKVGKKKEVEIPDASFDPECDELKRTWSSYARSIYCVNPYPNGITVSVHKQTPPTDAEVVSDDNEKIINFSPNQFHLRYRDTRDYQLPTGKYYLYKEGYQKSLENILSTLRKQGLLESAVVYLGTTVDPFLSLNKKFDVTMACIELLEQYKPGMVVVQTRSPMVISVLPFLKALGERVVVAMSIESRLESSITRYTPGQPRIKDRLVAVEGLRAQGIPVNLVVSPILPYGEYYRDAWEFAEMLDNHGDFITLGCLANGEPTEEAQLRALPLARRLVADNNFKLLRPYAYRHLFYALKNVAPEKLLLPAPKFRQSTQLSLFAA